MLIFSVSRMLAMVLIFELCARPADRKVLWEKAVPGPAIWAISFSPNGKLLAVGVADESGTAEIAVIGTSSPDSATLTVPVAEKIEMWVNESPHRIRWDKSSTCLSIVGRKTTYAVTDSSRCGELSTPSSVERAPNGGLLATVEANSIIVRDISGNMISQVKPRSVLQRLTFVGDRYICYSESFVTPSVACAEAISGTVVAQREGWWPRSWSSGGTRLALTDYHPNLFRLKLDAVLDRGSSPKDLADRFRKRLVWDVQSNRVVASWNPPAEKAGTGFRRFAFALSPDGHFLAEGAVGRVRLYELR